MFICVCFLPVYIVSEPQSFFYKIGGSHNYKGWEPLIHIVSRYRKRGYRSMGKICVIIFSTVVCNLIQLYGTKDNAIKIHSQDFYYV